MRIAAVVHNGVKHDARVLKGAASLKAQGHDVRLFGLTAGEWLPRDRDSSTWPSFRIQGETVFENVRATFKPDIVHMHDHLTLAAAAKYKEEFGCPLVWDAHEIYEDLASIEHERAAVNAR